MSEPIINPWVFYLIGLCDKVLVVCTLVAIVLLAAAVMMTICIAFDGDPVDKLFLKIMVILYAVGVVPVLLALFIPSGTTVTAMVAANNITPETVAAAGQTVTEAAEAITQVIVQTIKEAR